MATIPFSNGLQAQARKAPARLSLRRRAAIITGAALLPWLAIGGAIHVFTAKPAAIAAAPADGPAYSLILNSRGEVYELDYNLTVSDCFAELHKVQLGGADTITCQQMGS